jgi:hypothetical protein
MIFLRFYIFLLKLTSKIMTIFNLENNTYDKKKVIFLLRKNIQMNKKMEL